MEHHHLLLLLLLPLLLRLSSAAFKPTDKYLLNCGSDASAIFADSTDTRTFLPDSSSATAGSVALTNPNPPPLPSSPYLTARVFPSQSSYAFPIASPGPHIVRLHFSPFSTPSHNLSSASFSVSTSGFPLLTRFSAARLDLREFFLTVNTSSLTIQFEPQPSSFAFVNVIEVFTAPDNLILSAPVIVIGGTSIDTGLKTQLLETVYRVNVGGMLVTPVNDSLWRTWIPDDGFLQTSRSLAVPVVPPVSDIKYPGSNEVLTVEVAPTFVYGTARKMNNSGNSSSAAKFNLTWSFVVGPGHQKFLVRMHFCDIVSQALHELLFDSYINGYLATKDIDPSQLTTLSSPQYIDYVIDTNGSSSIQVSVGPSREERSKVNAYLNGVEIMRMHGEVKLVDTQNGKKQSSLLIALVVGGCLALAGIAVSLVYLFHLRKKRKPKQRVQGAALWSPLPGFMSSPFMSGRTNGSPLPNLNLELRIPFAEILLATNDFDQSSEVGSGGFGKVYKGLLQDGMKVAVKRAVRGSGQGLPEFHTEIMVLSKIRHRHLVSLIGYCEENSEMILVYEFMEKGTLRDHLYGLNNPSLSWKQRLEICIGAARGLHYLHTGSSQGIIHRDVKSANILLDENYLAKVADFGLSKLGPLINETHVSTTVKGSFGYLDPEYFRTQQLTDKSDIYSFGVVLLEVLLARPAIDRSLPYEQQNLAEWGMKWQKNGQLERIVDPSLRDTIIPNSLRKFGETVEKCLAHYGVDRPSMGDVLWNLEYTLQLQERGSNHESQENSISTASMDSVPNFQRVPISNMRIGRQSASGDPSDGASAVTTSQIFSQLITREGR